MRHPVLNNLGLKIISLGLAVLIYLVIKMSLDRQGHPASLLLRGLAKQEYLCPVLVLHSVTNAQAFKVQPSEVTVWLSGDAVVLRRLRPEDIQVYVRLLDGAPTSGVAALDVHPPRDVRLEDVQPPQVSILPVNPQ